MQSLGGRVVAQHVAQNRVAWPTVRPCPCAGLESPICRADNVARRRPYGQIKPEISAKHVIPLYGAAAAAWRVDTPARFVSKIFDAANNQNVALVRADCHGRRVVKILIRVPRRTRGRAINYLVAWAD